MSESRAGRSATSVGQDVLAGNTRATHLLAENVHCVLGDRMVLRDVSLTVAWDERVGLIGENGRGKSTLLRVLAGELAPQRGDVVRAVSGQVGFLPQEPGFAAGATVRDVLAAATVKIRELADRMRAVEEAMASPSARAEGELEALLEDYGQLQEEFVRQGGWEIEAGVGEVLEVFGLARVDRSRDTDSLSGGERARLALASLVLAEPAGLLLDEPTNHLDDHAVDWLLRWLTRYQGPCLIASHDRVLLDTAVTAIVDLDGPRGRVVRYGGNYRDYLAEHSAARQRWWQQYRDWHQQVVDARQRVDRASSSGVEVRDMKDHNKLAYHAAGSAAEAAAARATRAAHRHLNQLLTEQVPRPPEPLRFTTPDLDRGPDPAEGPLLRAEGLTVEGVLRDVGLALYAESRYVITGVNGAGKSTLLSLLAGASVPDRGEVTLAEGIRIGHLPQDSGFAEERRGLLAAFAARCGEYQDDAAAELTRFGLFGPDDVDVAVNRLSVGQRRRFELALLFAARPNLLLLDEPTNHLSLLLVEQFQEAVDRFPGPVVMVSHDRMLRERYSDQVLELVDGQLLARR